MRHILGFIFSLIASSVFGQNVSIGLEAGVLRSSIKGNIPEEFRYKTEPAGGLFLFYPINKYWKTNTTLFFAIKGSKFSSALLADSNSNNSVFMTGYDRLTYIGIQPGIEFNYNNYMFLFAAPYISFLANESKFRQFKVYRNNELVNTVNDDKIDSNEEFNHVDFGIATGIGFHYKQKIFLRLAVERGFINVIQDAPYNYHLTYKASLSFTLKSFN